MTFKKYVKEACIQLLFEFLGVFMITFALANYYSMSQWPTCEASKDQITYEEAFGPVATGTTSYAVFYYPFNWAPFNNIQLQRNSVNVYIGCKSQDLFGIFLTFFCAILTCQ